MDRKGSRIWMAAVVVSLCLHLTILAAGAFLPDLLPRPKRPEVYRVNLVPYQPRPAEQARAAKDVRPQRKTVERPPAQKPEQVRRQPPKKSNAKQKPAVIPKKESKRQKQAETTPERKVPKKRAKAATKPLEKRPEPVKEPDARNKLTKEGPPEKKTEPSKPPKTEAKKQTAEPSDRRQRQDVVDETRVTERIERIKEKLAEERLASAISGIKKRVESKDALPASGGTPDVQGERISTATVYGGIARAKIMAHFEVPPIIEREDLSAVVVIKVASSGRILTSVMKRGSGNSLFDRCAMRAIKDTGTLPPLPDALRPGPLEIEITFRSSDLRRTH